MSDVWYYAQGQKNVGPITFAELAAILSRVSVANEVFVWRSGFDGWVKAKNVKELAPYLNKLPPLPTESSIVAPEPATVQPTRIHVGKVAGALTCAIWIVISILLYDPLSTIPALTWLFVICFASIAVAIFWTGKRKISFGVVAGTALGLLLSWPIVDDRVESRNASSLGFASVGDLHDATRLGLKTPEELASRREVEATAEAKRKQEEEAVTAEKKAAPQRLAQRAISKLPMQPKWDRIEIQEAKDNSYMLTLVYRYPPSSFIEIESDTKAIARAVLSELIASGVNPSSSWSSVGVFAERPIRGETGASRVESYGHTMYNFNSDQLEFELAKH